jgi:flagellar motor switch protein FliG/flagellar motor switch protein FliM
MHETFARQTTTALSSALRSLAHVHVASVDQLTYEEFIRSVPNPTTLGVIDMDPLKGSAILMIDPAITAAFIDRLFGGPGKAANHFRTLTDIECAVMEGIYIRMLGNLRAAWVVVMDLRPRLTKLECNPHFVQIVPPNEMIVLVTFEVRIGDAEGMINLCIPYLTIEPIIPKLSAQYVYAGLRHGPEIASASIASLPMVAEVCFEGEHVALSTLANLKRGARIGIPRYAEGKAFLHSGGSPILRLTAHRTRGARRTTYSVDENRIAMDLRALGAAGKKAQEEKVDTLQDALHSLSSEIGATVKSLQGSITNLARKQEEMADHLLLPNTDRDAGSTEQVDVRKRPFAWFTMAECSVLAMFISKEHPQLIALVLSYLEPSLAACVLAKIPEEMRTDVAARICMMDRTSPEVLREVERVLEKSISTIITSQDYIAAGGIDSVVEILNIGSRSLEKGVVESLEKLDPQMAEEIKKRMFVFEDIVLLDRKAIGLVVKEAVQEDFALALKATDEEVRKVIWDCISKADSEAMKVRMESLGHVRLRDVEEAQQRIVGVIRKMEEEGRIMVARADETVV